ncbi:MAG: YicC family protein [Clostridia bacterium]|nr:YicC family protein [Clostridia bacterium]
MIKSMTGYGSGSAEAQGKIFTIEIKSVNNRYSDFNIKLPRIYSFLEDALRKRAASVINRGKVDIFFNVESSGEEASNVKVNMGLAKGYLEALRSLSNELGIQSNANAETFLRISDIFTVEKDDANSEEIASAVLSALDEALASYDKMRAAEGEKLKEDLNSHLDFIENATEKIENRSPEIVKEYQERLYARVRELLEDSTIDDSRVLTEVAIFADRVNVNEETVRLRSHIAQFRKMLENGGVVGRKLDFLIQEMNRETNTIGSKSNDLESSEIVIDIKAEIEKLREQIQNVE